MLRILAVLGLLLAATPAAAAPAAAKRVFILNSYRPGVEWADGQLRGIQSQLDSTAFEVQTWVDYLDAARNPRFAAEFRARYRNQYAHQHFDLIIATDDDALQLLHSDAALFPGTPVVFGGVSDRSFLTSLPRGRFAGVIEVFAELTMIELALKIHPRTSRICLVADGTPLSRYFVDSLKRRAASATWALEILDSQKLTFDEIVLQLRNRSPHDLVFLARLGRDSTGAYLSPAVHYSQIAAASPVPVYGLASAIGQGLLGGTANTGTNHGRHIGKIALQILGGARPASVPFVEDAENVLLFDARQMARFGVSDYRLPPGTEVFFQNDSLLERYQAWIFLAVAFAALQMFIIGGLAINMQQRGKAKRALLSFNAQLEARNQQLAAAAETKKRFVANMSHELRTPMNAVIGMSDLLLETPLDPRQREFAETVRNSAYGLLGIVNDVLELSRAEAGHIRVETSPFAPQPLFHELVRFLTPSVTAGVTIHTSVHSAVPPFLVTDSHRVRQVLLNFLFNAIKFTPSGKIELSVTPDGDGQFRFAVTDTGIGIALSQLEHVFDRFYQVDDSTRRQYGGSGLGLAISREIVHALGGQIGTESVLGLGSTFWFRIPAAALDHAPPAPAAPAPPPIGLRVLVVEDNIVNLRVVTLLLQKLGCSVQTAPGGAEAVSTLRNASFEIVFMDVQMPGMDGLEATRQIRRLEGEGHHTPIIALTAGVSTEDRSLCLEAGMDDHLAKPISRDQLSQVLSRYAPKSAS